MQTAVLEKPIAGGALDADRLRAVVLVRIASAGRGTQRAMSQRPPDARITGGFAPILLKSRRNARRS